MSDKPRSTNAFSEQYVAHLRDLDEPEGPWARDLPDPLVIYEVGGLFGLFRPWQRPDAGDEPEATFTSLEDARLCLASRLALRRKRYYELQPVPGARPPQGYPVMREGVVVGHLRTFDPDWVHACHVLTCLAQSSEHMVTVLDLAGPTTLEQIGEILGRAASNENGRPDSEDDTKEETTRR